MVINHPHCISYWLGMLAGFPKSLGNSSLIILPFFFFTKYYIKKEGSSQTIWGRREGRRGEKKSDIWGKYIQHCHCFGLTTLDYLGQDFYVLHRAVALVTGTVFWWVVAFVVSVTAILMNASIDHCHP